LFTAYFHLASAQNPTPSKDYYSPLETLKTPVTGSVEGGQSFKRCCLKAVEAWKDNPNIDGITVESSKKPGVIFKDPNDEQLRSEQFPCGAEYDDDEDGATRVQISYFWCKTNCPGWERSRSAVLTQWLQPFIGFILPAAVFCLNVSSSSHGAVFPTNLVKVPRKMVFDISDELFPDSLEVLKNDWDDYFRKIKKGKIGPIFDGTFAFAFSTLKNGVELIIRAAIAAAIGLINVVVWVVIVFATAAPMILSGLYEAALDRQLLRAVEDQIKDYKRKLFDEEKVKKLEDAKNDHEQVQYQVHLLYATLIGNLKLLKSKSDNDPTQTDNKDKEAGPSKNEDINTKDDPSTSVKADEKIGATNTEEDSHHTQFGHESSRKDAPLDINTKDDLITSANTDEKTKPTSTQKDSSERELGRAWVDVSDMMDGLNPPNQTPENYEVERRRTEVRLKTMLGCQASFGASVGAPVAFFLGSFLFSVFSNLENLGDGDTSLSLAFGEWWMTIPHVAIVSGCLLAGNNPNTLEAIISGVKQLRKSTDPDSSGGFWNSLKAAYAPFYESVYQPVWGWERGRSKRNWIRAVQRKYKRQTLDPSESRPIFTRFKTLFENPFKDTKVEDVPDIGIIGWLFLIFTASVLIVTPFVLAYVTSYYTPTIGLSCRTFTFLLYFVFQCCLTAVWFHDFPNPKGHPLYYGNSKFKPTIFFLVTFICFLGSAFTAIIGTFMQILGVYRNCLCNIPMNHWSSRDFPFTVSSNSAQMIHYAKIYWLSTGIASICLLVIFCYFGWWYQRHWRSRFNKVVEDVLDVSLEKKEKKDAAKQLRKDNKKKTPAHVAQNAVGLVKADEDKEDTSDKEGEEEFRAAWKKERERAKAAKAAKAAKEAKEAKVAKLKPSGDAPSVQQSTPAPSVRKETRKDGGTTEESEISPVPK
jgi:hypothetical protein